MCQPEFNFCFPIEVYERDEGRASGNGPPIKETRRLVSRCELRVARIYCHREHPQCPSFMNCFRDVHREISITSEPVISLLFPPQDLGACGTFTSENRTLGF